MRSMEESTIRKLIARLGSDNINEQHTALAAIDRKAFTDIAVQLDAIADAEQRTGYSFTEIINIIVKRWPKREAGWAGMSGTRKFATHRILMAQDWLTEHERHRMIEINDRLCVAPGNPETAGDVEFMDSILRKAKVEGVRI
jgi:hypothetical protein